MTTKKRAIIALSGGMDSATVLAEAIASERECFAVGFTYGSKHNTLENQAAQAHALYYGVEYRLIDLTTVSAGFPSLRDDNVDAGLGRASRVGD